jgi:hypothetical protein
MAEMAASAKTNRPNDVVALVATRPERHLGTARRSPRISAASQRWQRPSNGEPSSGLAFRWHGGTQPPGTSYTATAV